MTSYVDRTVVPPEGIDPKVSGWVKSQNDGMSLHLAEMKREQFRRSKALPWTPTITFATAGDLAVTYSVQTGEYVRADRIIELWGRIETSAYTFSTASGVLEIVGVPLACSNSNTNYVSEGSILFEGITKTGYTNFCARITAGRSFLGIGASGSGKTLDNVQAADTTSGTNLILRFHISYRF